MTFAFFYAEKAVFWKNPDLKRGQITWIPDFIYLKEAVKSVKPTKAAIIERVLFIKPKTCPLSVRPKLYKQKEVTTGNVQWIHGHVLRILQFFTWNDLLQCYMFGPEAERVKKAYHHLQLWSKVE